MTFVKFTALALLIQSLAIGCVIAILYTEWAVPGKQIVAVMFVITLTAVFYWAGSYFPFRKVLYLSSILVAGAIVFPRIIGKILGFTFYLGHHKVDMKPFSDDHLIRIGIEFILIFGFYLLVMCAVSGSRKINRLLRKDDTTSV